MFSLNISLRILAAFIEYFIRKLRKGATTIVLQEISPTKEGACPKREIDTDRLENMVDILQKSDIDYKAH